MLNCKKCNKEFEPETKVQTYCHEPCRPRMDPREAFLNRKPRKKLSIHTREEFNSRGHSWI